MNEYTMNKVQFAYDSLEDAFPTIDPDHDVLGTRILVQIRSAKDKTAGGIIIPDEAKETERWNTQVAKVLAIGPGAFKDRKTGEYWPEGPWFEVGEFVRAPKYGGDRWSKPLAGYADIVFAIFNDLDFTSKVKGDPRTIRAYL
jgi:co-chaperonin GroES (HSP10)